MVDIITSRTASGLNKLEEGGYSSESLLNENLSRLDHGATRFRVLDRSLSNPSGLGTPNDEDCYLVSAAGDGDWTGKSNNIALWLDDLADWTFIAPRENMIVYVDDEDTYTRWNGSAWVDRNRPWLEGSLVSVQTGITASVTQTQGQQALTKEWNEVSTCATTNDVVTLPTVRAGRRCVIWNRGAETLQVFPASGDKINGGSTDASVTIAAAGKSVFCGIDDAEWLTE